MLGEESQIALHEQHRDGGNTLLTLAAPLQRPEPQPTPSPEPQSAPLQRLVPQPAPLQRAEPLQKRPRLTELYENTSEEACLEKLFAMMLTGDPEHKNSTLDATGVRHYYPSDTIRSANAKGKKKGQRLCPVCCHPCHTAANKCQNVENCTYKFKKGSTLTGASKQVQVLRKSAAGKQVQGLSFTELELSRAVARIKASYFESVNVKAAQTALGLLTLPLMQPDSYLFDEHSSADRLHCLSWDAVQLVLQDKDGLSPSFAQMAPGQRIQAVWFREATITEVDKGIKHTIEKHVKYDTNKTIYGFIVKQEHAACRLIVPTKHNHQFYSMVNIPTNELILVKLN